MTLEDRALKICNCNKTIALDAKALGAALKLTQPIQMHTELCRKEVGSFQESLKDSDAAEVHQYPRTRGLVEGGRSGDAQDRCAARARRAARTRIGAGRELPV